jgi:hypothetical protein
MGTTAIHKIAYSFWASTADTGIAITVSPAERAFSCTVFQGQQWVPKHLHHYRVKE